MLGFDTAEQSCVWLVASILPDYRLKRAPGGDVPITNDCTNGPALLAVSPQPKLQPVAPLLKRT
jgi:hypothetical protein